VSDIKPDNILVNWTSGSEGKQKVTDVVLGDFDIACKLEPGAMRLTPHAVGNAMWRSPEGQTGISSLASDVYSLGLVVSVKFQAETQQHLTSANSTFSPWELEKFLCLATMNSF
jgi:serine/threonine protein kinase